MKITELPAFLVYLEKVHERSARVIACVTPEALEWTPVEGRWSCGDIIRHLAGIERWMYAETILGRPSTYAGHERHLAEGLAATVAYYEQSHAEAMAIFGMLTAEQLKQRVNTPAGVPITAWKWMRAMVEHEAHHRGQLYLMLGLQGIPTPPLYGLTSEQVRDGVSTAANSRAPRTGAG